MKKSSIILIATLALLAVTAFILPPVMGNEVSDVATETEYKPIILTGKTKTIEFEPLDTIELASVDWHQEKRGIVSPIARIVETDSVSKPCVVIDTAWANLLKINQEAGVCTLSLSNPDEGDDSTVLTIRKESALCMTVMLPRGTEHKFSCIKANNVELILDSFRDASLTLDSDRRFDLLNCDFKDFKCNGIAIY